MTPKINYFERIDDYCLNQLDAEAKAEFEAELMLDAKLRDEVKLRFEIQSSIAEQDVIDLREKLKAVKAQAKITGTQTDSFALLSDFSDFNKISKELSTEELINYFDSMPKVHVYQHELTSKENIHPFYKEQLESMTEEGLNDLEDFDIEDLDGLEEAILEKDIFNFRRTLKQVAKSVEPQFTVEEIDNYLSNELEEKELLEFEKELSQNFELREEIKLHEDIEKSVQEIEIFNLRKQISQIKGSETSWNVSEQDIEKYINDELEGELLAELESELSENLDLKAEVKLRKEVNEVIGEKDIRSLKEKLVSSKELSEVSTVRKIVPESNMQLFRFVRNGAAAIIILLGITSFLNNNFVSKDKVYSNYFESPQWASERSGVEDFTFLNLAQSAFIKGDYSDVINLNTNAPGDIANSAVFQFYTAASFQNMEKYQDAIGEYTKVINNGDNLFVEEAEWYRSLCYFKDGDKLRAKQELLAVIDRNGHYAKDARAVLRKLKHIHE